MRFKFWLIVGCAIVMVIGTILAFSRAIETEGKISEPTLPAGSSAVSATPESPAATIDLPAATQGLPAATIEMPAATPDLPFATPGLPAATPLLPSATPVFTATLAPQTPAATVRLPKQLIQSAGTPVEDFENVKDWVRIAGNAPAADTANFKNGKQALHVTSGSTATVVQKRVNWDLSQSQAIRFWANHFINGNDTYEVDLATRADYSAYFSAQVMTFGKKWNLKQIGRDQFQSHGGASWKDPIVGIRFKINPNQDYSFDSLLINVKTVPVVMIAFDDGDATVYTTAMNILKNHGMAATAYVPTNLIGTPGFMTVAQLLELQANGWTIGNHTANHTFLKGLPEDNQLKELSTALSTLKAWGLTGGKYVAYPNGKYDTVTLKVMDQLGMLTGRTVSDAPDVFPDLNLYVMRTTQDVSGYSLADIQALVTENKKRGSVLTLLFHSIGSGTALDSQDWNAGMFNELLKSIAASGQPVLTIDQFYTLTLEGIQVYAPRP